MRKSKMFAEIVLLLTLFAGRGTAQLLCGQLIYYNTSTHECVDSLIVEKDDALEVTLVCGPLLEKYDTRTHDCVDNKIVNKTEDKHVTVLPCGLKHESRSEKCCRDQVYYPDFQTCCKSSVYWQKYKVHFDRPEKKHVCCKLEVYKRRSPEAVCHRSAHNDKYFQPKKLHLKRLKSKNNLCKDYMDSLYIYLVFINSHIWNPQRRYMKASVSEFMLDNLKAKRSLFERTGSFRIRLDEHSPKKDLTGKRFLIFTYHQYIQRRGFRLRFDENVYRLPKNARPGKIFARLRRKCKKLKRHNFKRRNG